jgi:hypothetical protein
MANLRPEHYLFPSRLAKSPHVSTCQSARIVHQWVAAIGLDSTVYGTHTLQWTKATLIHKRTKNLRASFNSCLVISSWSALFDTLGSRSMTRRRSRSRLKSSTWDVGCTQNASIGCGRFVACRGMGALGQIQSVSVISTTDRSLIQRRHSRNS